MGLEDLNCAPWHHYPNRRPPSQTEMLNQMKPGYLAAIQSGRLRPPTIPWMVISYVIMASFLMIDHRQRYWLYQCRWLVWGLICYIEWGNLIYSSSIEPATAYMTGVLAVWAVIWSSCWLVWTRPQFTAQRVERRRKRKAGEAGGERKEKEDVTDRNEVGGKKPKLDAQGRRVSFAASGWELPDKKSSATLMHTMNGDATTAPPSETESGTTTPVTKGKDARGKQKFLNRTKKSKVAIARASAIAKAKTAEEEDEWEYFWQPYPTKLTTRIGWVTDLILSFRGQGWNFSIPSNPPLPPNIAESLGEPVSRTLTSGVGVQRFASRSELAKYQLPKFLLCYLILDLVKLHILWDPYFRTGRITDPAPFYLSRFGPSLQLFARRNIQLVGIITAIEYVELLAPLVFCLLLGPNSFLGLRGAAWHYPTTWGGPHIILTKSLNGLWGGWWHQTFRIGFAAPSNYLIRHDWMSRRSFGGQVTALLIAFSISGSLHLCGSFSQLPVTHPFGPLRFFLLQVPGILIQALFTASFSKQIQRFPSWSRKTANGVYSLFWLFLTSGSFADDLNRGGVWMFEPLPWSPLRALGLAPNEEGMWPWDGIHVEYWSSTRGRWWESGWALFLEGWNDSPKA